MFLMIVFLFVRVNDLSLSVSGLKSDNERQVKINESVSKFIEVVAKNSY